MRILVTNDDGIDSTGLHVLVQAMCELDGAHEIVVAAPDSEYSGAGAAIGALHLIKPVIRRAALPAGAPPEVWTVAGPPALCVMFARLQAFGPPPQLVVSGINPGANVGRAVYHSGTVGAALTGRNGNASGVAISQSVAGYGVEGQGWDEMLADQRWETAAAVAKTFVQALVDAPPREPVVANINVPNVDLAEIKGWRHTMVGQVPPRSVSKAELHPVSGHEGAFTVSMDWGEALELPADTDTGAIERNEISVSYLSRLDHQRRDDMRAADAALDGLFG
jgi:5'-nucleotidase